MKYDPPIYGDCESCELKPQCDKELTCPSYVPETFNGIMLIGEGPGRQEVAKQEPFIGQAGSYLTAFLEYAGIDRKQCYIANATSCLPPPKKKALHDEFPTAIPSCLGRLEEEIAEVRPRVIVSLGSPALISMISYDRPINRQRPLDCPDCNNKRRVGPVLQCGGCGELVWFDVPHKDAIGPDVLQELKSTPCPACEAKRTRLRPKMIKCPTCKGRKTETFIDNVFSFDYKISEVAGAIFIPGKELPLESYELDPWYGQQGVKYLVPTYHPSFVMRGNQFYAEVVVKHLQRARWLLDHDIEPSIKYQVTTDPDVLIDFCFNAPWPVNERINLKVDIETEAWRTTATGEREQLDARKVENVTAIKCIGFARNGEALVVDTRNIDPADPDDSLLNAIADVLLNTSLDKTYQNGMCYDIPVMDRIWGIPWDQQVDSYTDDTITAYHALYPDEPHNLAHTTLTMTNSFAWKPPKTVKGAEIHENFDDLALYNARDVINTEAVLKACGASGGKAIKGGLLEQEEVSAAYSVDCELNRIAIGMTMNGMPLDKERWRNVRAEAQEKLTGAIQTAREALAVTNYPNPDDFNPFQTAAHLIPALYSTKGFNMPVLVRTDKKQPSTKQSVIASLMSQTGSEGMRFLKAITDVRAAKKVIGTYIEGQKPWADGRLHAQWKPYGTKTGRFSSSPNMQNFSGWLRSLIKAPDGRLICGADYSQLELRAMAALAGDKELIRRCMEADEGRKLEPDWDPHSYVASIVFGKTFVDLPLDSKKRKALRDLVKNVIYALNYGAGDKRIVATIYSKGYEGPPVTIELVKRVRRIIFKEFSGIPKWRDRQLKESAEKAELRSPLHNRRRVFPCNDQMPIPVTEVYNYPIQSVAADIMNEATLLLDKRLTSVDPTAFLIAQVHDALYVECNEDKSVQVCRLIEDCMIMEKFGMLFNATAHAAKTWEDA